MFVTRLCSHYTWQTDTIQTVISSRHLNKQNASTLLEPELDLRQEGASPNMSLAEDLFCCDGR